MNEKEKITIQLDQNRIDQDKLIDEQSRLQNELCELEEPKLRHLDWGVFEGMVRIFIKECGGEFNAYALGGGKSGSDVLNGFAWQRGKYKIKGNLTDDLKRNSEDLEEFRVATTCCSSGFLNVLIVESGINFNIVKENRIGKCFTVDEATEIHQKLGQLIATAKRKQSE